MRLSQSTLLHPALPLCHALHRGISYYHITVQKKKGHNLAHRVVVEKWEVGSVFSTVKSKFVNVFLDDIFMFLNINTLHVHQKCKPSVTNIFILSSLQPCGAVQHLSDHSFFIQSSCSCSILINPLYTICPSPKS